LPRLLLSRREIFLGDLLDIIHKPFDGIKVAILLPTKAL
jgi:hypothetical protein